MTAPLNPFAPAVRRAKRLRIGIESPAGAGKTFTALKLATALAEHDQGKIAVIDTERGSSAMYGEGRPFDFDLAHIDSYDPGVFVSMMNAAANAGYAVVVIDSASHEWKGTLGIVDRTGRDRQNNTWSAWSVARPAHDSFVDTLVSLPAHVIATFRSKQETEQYKEDGKTKVRKLGLAPVASDDMDYEFDVWCSIAHDTHDVIVSKSRVDTIPVGSEWKFGDGLIEAYFDWLDGREYEAPPPTRERARLLTVQAMRDKPVRNADVARFTNNDPYTWLAEHGFDYDGLIAAVLESMRVPEEPAQAELAPEAALEAASAAKEAPPADEHAPDPTPIRPPRARG